MKAYLLVVALAVIPACGQQNDIDSLEHEAVAIAQYYQPKVDQLGTRLDAIFARGQKIPGNLPGIQDVGRRLQEARAELEKLRGIVGKDPKQPTKPSPLEQQTKAAANEGNAEELEKLVDEANEELAAGVTILNDDLTAAESWIAQYDRGMLAMASPSR